MNRKSVGWKFLIQEHKNGFVMLIPLLLLLFVLVFMENMMQTAYEQMRFQFWQEKQVQYDIYVMHFLSEALGQAEPLSVGAHTVFLGGDATHTVSVTAEDLVMHERTVIWRINFDGISRSCSFIMGENGNFVEWNYR